MPVRVWPGIPTGPSYNGKDGSLLKSRSGFEFQWAFHSIAVRGVVVATSHLIYPQAVGGDIGCGMLAVALDVDAASLGDPRVAGHVLAELSRAVPARRRNRRKVIQQPEDVAGVALSNPSLESIRRNEGAIEFATLGSGNHFIEIQADEDN